jgi:hypothetical protein
MAAGPDLCGYIDQDRLVFESLPAAPFQLRFTWDASKADVTIWRNEMARDDGLWFLIEEYSSCRSESQFHRKLPIGSGRFGSPTSRLTRLFLVGPRGLKLKPALLSYTADGPPEQPSRHSDPQRERRVTKRLNTATIERLVAEYTAGATAALQSGGAGILSVIRA